MKKLNSQTVKGFTGIEVLVVLAVVGALGGGTLLAADQSKPGDLLFPIDTALEEVRVALTTSAESKATLRVQYATERVEEISDLLKEKGVEAPGIQVALENLSQQKVRATEVLLQAKAQGREIAQKAKATEDAFEEQEKALEEHFKAVKAPLKLQKRKLQDQLKQALEVGNTSLVTQLREEIVTIETKLDSLELQEEAAGRLEEAAIEAKGKSSEEGEKNLEETQKEVERLTREAQETRKQAEEATKKLKETKNTDLERLELTPTQEPESGNIPKVSVEAEEDEED